MTPVHFVQSLVRAGWKLQPKKSPLQLPRHLLSWRPSLPPTWLRFVEQIDCCANPAETAWFLTEADFRAESTGAYRWNEFEIMSLEAAQRDQQLEAQIRDFWNRHLPILISVKSSYAYIAVRLDSPGESVICGTEPEFEQPSHLADSLEEFFQHFAGHLLGQQPITRLESMI